jgi:BirA family transcriptional regulator, biotin operon repressor / biotin---[acetyl-CoA-carboxylase] ligase
MTPIIRTVEETGSTNADMLALAATGLEEGNWLRAVRQTSGKGRLGRHWDSPPGNFYGSTIIRLRPGDPAPSTLAFVASVALIEVLQSLAPQVPLMLKWPNDVLANGAKLCGILLERSGNAIILGMGVNLAHHPQGLDRPVASIASLGATPPDPAHFAAQLAEHFTHWLSRWRGEGVATILSAWQAKAHPQGTPLTANLPDGVTLSGSYQGLDNDGALKLALADGAVRAIHAADVFLV